MKHLPYFYIHIRPNLSYVAAPPPSLALHISHHSPSSSSSHKNFIKPTFQFPKLSPADRPFSHVLKRGRPCQLRLVTENSFSNREFKCI